MNKKTYGIVGLLVALLVAGFLLFGNTPSEDAAGSFSRVSSGSASRAFSGTSAKNLKKVTPKAVSGTRAGVSQSGSIGRLNKVISNVSTNTSGSNTVGVSVAGVKGDDDSDSKKVRDQKAGKAPLDDDDYEVAPPEDEGSGGDGVTDNEECCKIQLKECMKDGGADSIEGGVACTAVYNACMNDGCSM